MVLFDEVEKAHGDVFNILLQVRGGGLFSSGARWLCLPAHPPACPAAHLSAGLASCVLALREGRLTDQPACPAPEGPPLPSRLTSPHVTSEQPPTTSILGDPLLTPLTTSPLMATHTPPHPCRSWTTAA